MRTAARGWRDDDHRHQTAKEKTGADGGGGLRAAGMEAQMQRTQGWWGEAAMRTAARDWRQRRVTGCYFQFQHHGHGFFIVPTDGAYTSNCYT